jgi:ATP-dependent Lhr-like helicase
LQLGLIRDDFAFVRDGRTSLERDHQRQRSRWWTFAGGRANAELARRCHAAGIPTSGADDLGVGLLSMTPVETLEVAIARQDVPAAVDEARLDAVKFQEAVPREALARMVAARDEDRAGMAQVVGEPIVVA